jgi:hypothetical protein
MNNKKPPEFTYDAIVIGSSLEAILFAFYNKIKMVWTRNLCPEWYEKLDKDFGLGTNSLEIWNKHSFQLGIAGYTPFGNSIKRIYYCGDNRLRLVSVEDNVYFVNFQKAYIFDDYKLEDVGISINKTADQITVYDTFKLRRFDNVESFMGTCHSRKNNLFTTLNFYKHLRSYHVVAKSITSQTALDSSGFEEYYTTIKLPTYLKSLKLAGKDAFVKHLTRRAVQNYQNIYDDFDNLIFCYPDAETIYTFAWKRAKIDYMKYFRMKIGISQNE